MHKAAVPILRSHYGRTKNNHSIYPSAELRRQLHGPSKRAFALVPHMFQVRSVKISDIPYITWLEYLDHNLPTPINHGSKCIILLPWRYDGNRCTCAVRTLALNGNVTIVVNENYRSYDFQITWSVALK